MGVLLVYDIGDEKSYNSAPASRSEMRILTHTRHPHVDEEHRAAYGGVCE